MTKYNNPIVPQRADPCVYKHTDGFYYFVGSIPGYQSIAIRKAKTLNELKDAAEITVWRAHASGPLSKLIWAPEIHFIKGKWYIYFAAAATEEIHPEHVTFQHRMYVIECADADPLKGKWEEKGQIKTFEESFALDATQFEHNGVHYYVWAQKDPKIEGNSNLYISKMKNPWTLEGKTEMITKPEFDWECIGFKVNEGAFALKRNGKIFITYSGSATDENYAMGMVWADENADLLDAKNWHKSKEPVFKSSAKNGQWGPGHNSFTKSEDGTEDVIIYHARDYFPDGEPLDNPDRHARAQVFSFDEKGFPVFGEPVK